MIKRQEHPVEVRSVEDLSLRARKVVQKGYFEYKVFDAKDLFSLFGIEKLSKNTESAQVPADDFNTFFEKADELKKVMENISELESEAKELLLDLKHNSKVLNENKKVARNLKQTLSALLNEN